MRAQTADPPCLSDGIGEKKRRLGEHVRKQGIYPFCGARWEVSDSVSEEQST